MKKFTVLFSFLLLFTLIFVNSSYAATASDYYPLPLNAVEEDNFEYILSYNGISKKVELRIFGYDHDTFNPKLYNISSGSSSSVKLPIAHETYYIYTYHYSDGVWYFDNKADYAYGQILYTELYESSLDIYTDSSATSIFFQKTPVTEQPEIIPETVEIPAVETVEQIPTAMVETLKMIIPVGLVVLSVVLLIYLTRRLIYRCS